MAACQHLPYRKAKVIRDKALWESPKKTKRACLAPPSSVYENAPAWRRPSKYFRHYRRSVISAAEAIYHASIASSLYAFWPSLGQSTQRGWKLRAGR
jgi:hypothetical protein